MKFPLSHSVKRNRSYKLKPTILPQFKDLEPMLSLLPRYIFLNPETNIYFMLHVFGAQIDPGEPVTVWIYLTF